MSITAYSIFRSGSRVTVTVTSDQAAPDVVVYYHWYLDGAWQGATVTAARDFWADPGDQFRVDVVDTLDAGFDPIAGAPDGFPARRAVYWVRSLDTENPPWFYRVEYRPAGGTWATMATVGVDGDRWQYSADSPRLNDLTTYEFRVYAVDNAGNQTAVPVVSTAAIVRRPDAPNYTVAVNPDRTLTFTAVT